ncbi:intraflagellar transport-associated protein isoform X1 [Xenopus laevis]|uniref:Intraflagellar transport-associated protein isoform X1 n=1 Tax=Xenopus laevis TaxID=8355 RepID=A0A8J1MXG5_XENLA|nr:intraflagellar transport-associated protein isoform X1 [Xenopus laevis]
MHAGNCSPRLIRLWLTAETLGLQFPAAVQECWATGRREAARRKGESRVMPSSLTECSIMSEGDQTSDVLDRFISIPEQSYEQFLGTFTHPPKGSICGFGSSAPFATLDLRRCLRSSNLNSAGPERQLMKFGPFSVSEQQCVWQRARAKDNAGDRNTDSAAKESDQVDMDSWNMDSSDYETDNEDRACSSLELLPGEAECEGPSYIPSFSRSTRLDFRTLPSCQNTAANEQQTEEVQPFALEAGFDYDHVALTPKFSVSELKFLGMERPEKITREESTDQTEI